VAVNSVDVLTARAQDDAVADWPLQQQAMAATWLLVAMRVTGLLLLAPPLSSLAVPVVVRVAIALVLAAALLPAQPAVAAGAELSLLLQTAVLELSRGALMALGAIVGFAAFAVAARLLDVQIGFGMAGVYDPSTRQSVPVLSAAFAVLAPALFVATDGHHVLLRALAHSFERLPVGSAWPLEAVAESLHRQTQDMFVLGLAMVAPVVLCLALIELALGVLSRSLPQMQVFVVGIPVKVLSGMAALAAWMVAASAPMARAFESIYRGWEASLR
jgi:flagellar biosynthetic protein FliR